MKKKFYINFIGLLESDSYEQAILSAEEWIENLEARDWLYIRHSYSENLRRTGEYKECQ